MRSPRRGAHVGLEERGDERGPRLDFKSRTRNWLREGCGEKSERPSTARQWRPRSCELRGGGRCRPEGPTHHQAWPSQIPLESVDPLDRRRNRAIWFWARRELRDKYDRMAPQIGVRQGGQASWRPGPSCQDEARGEEGAGPRGHNR
jgi:hypothetical protein